MQFADTRFINRNGRMSKIHVFFLLLFVPLTRSRRGRVGCLYASCTSYYICFEKLKENIKSGLTLNFDTTIYWSLRKRNDAVTRIMRTEEVMPKKIDPVN